MQQAQSGASYIAVAPNSKELEAQQEQAHDGHRAAQRIKAHLQKADSTSLELESVYGSAIALPQLARCAGYDVYFTQHAVRAYMFMMLNCYLQFMLVYSLAKEEIVMAGFSGRIRLCDFGIRDQGAGSVTGPGGTIITAPRLYDFDIWYTRTYVRDSLLALFPDKREEIHKHVDPGEYGSEWGPIRIVCVVLFIMAVKKDFYEIYEMGRFFWITPSQNESWLHYKAPLPKFAEDSEEALLQNGGSRATSSGGAMRETQDAEEADHLEGVTIKVAGMATHWKLFYAITVLLPKALLWKGTTQLGVTFLMETASISDVIVNSMALAFVLNIDELVYTTFTAPEAKFLMENLVQYSPPPAPSAPLPACVENIWFYLKLIIPRRLFLTALLSGIFLWYYYSQYCEWGPDGILVSKDMYLPEGTSLNPITAFLPNFALPKHEVEPYWQMQG
eukprot:TRINITY_DN94702_c0_g1_i1.p1 TRINITY_DN94702_c0_g1~~TRINITY_DN94702_c0_g1_i1.p1  ORF type:complete len:446 (-),score=50.35 TRINITY_DN94702_c0_g1_i1:37-1374(-)